MACAGGTSLASTVFSTILPISSFCHILSLLCPYCRENKAVPFILGALDVLGVKVFCFNQKGYSTQS